MITAETELAPDEATCAQARLIDIGSGRRAGSLESAQRRFGVAGIGLDIRKPAIRDAQQNGLPVYFADLREIDPSSFPAAQYVMLDNVLEHLPTLDDVADAIGRVTQIASRLVHIRHPSFEDEEYLAALGLKQYWTDWPRTHTAHIRLHEFIEMASRVGVYRTIIVPVKRAYDSSDPTMVPLGVEPRRPRRKRDGGRVGQDGPEIGQYDEAAHGPKPRVTFDRPVYYAYDVFLITGDAIPQLEYRYDREVSPARPRIRWPGKR